MGPLPGLAPPAACIRLKAPPLSPAWIWLPQQRRRSVCPEGRLYLAKYLIVDLHDSRVTLSCYIQYSGAQRTALGMMQALRRLGYC